MIELRPLTATSTAAGRSPCRVAVQLVSHVLGHSQPSITLDNCSAPVPAVAGDGGDAAVVWVKAVRPSGNAIMSQMQESPSRDYDDLKQDIDNRYPSGHFVAVESGKVIADADSHPELARKLGAMKKSPKNMLIVQAGVEYPESAIILLNASDRGSTA